MVDYCGELSILGFNVGAAGGWVSGEIPLGGGHLLYIALLPPIPRADFCLLSRSWRLARLQAISSILSHQIPAAADRRVRASALTLTAGLVWLLNCLHSRPDDRQAARRIIDAVFPHSVNQGGANLPIYLGEDGADYEVSKAYAPFGVLFLRDIQLPPGSPCPRMRVGTVIDDRTCIAVFGKDMGALSHEFNPAIKIHIRPNRVGCRKSVTHGNHRADHTTLFPALEAQAVPGDVDDGSDAGEFVVDMPNQSLNDLLTDLWHQSFADILQKASCPKGQGLLASYVRLTEGERVHVNLNWFKEFDLAPVLRCAYWKQATAAQWLTQFELHWPTRGAQLPPSTQGWSHCQYYSRWRALLTTMTAMQEGRLRKQLWEMWKGLTWMPKVEPGRLWCYSKWGVAERLPLHMEAKTDKATAPHVFMNPAVRGRLKYVIQEGEEDEWM